LQASKKSRQIKQTFSGKVHITPVIQGKHYLGATYTKHNDKAGPEQTDNRELLASLNSIYPGMFSEADICGAWTGFRTVSKDRVPIVGGVADEAFFLKEYADICHGKVNRCYPSADYLEGLYVSAAHGSRGFTSSFLCAEIIASQIEGEPSPVSSRVLKYISPSRFIINNLKRGHGIK
jgi:tRNA 5-methylaminomethyl-2-thiouridine biosynthesis bifunctional protein